MEHKTGLNIKSGFVLVLVLLLAWYWTRKPILKTLLKLGEADEENNNNINWTSRSQSSFSYNYQTDKVNHNFIEFWSVKQPR